MARLLQFNVAKVLLAFGLFLSIHSNLQSTNASSIPIWEFLTRNEKMSYLYSTFAQLVSVHCKATTASSNIPVNQCKRDLLSYGYEKLQTFNDAQLDAFDPYQRGASQLIWTSIMRDHPSSTLVTTRKPLPTPPATSIVIMTHQQPHTSNTKTKFVDSTTSANHYPKNPMFESSEHKHQYAMDMDIAYGQPSMAHNPQIDVFDVNAHKTYLTGPSVVRVKPDGSPVEEDQHRAPAKDDDLEAYTSAVTYGRNEDIKVNTNANQQQKHRKIATINALKQQYLANLARQQQELLPPYEDARRRRRRHQPIVYHYGGIRV
ncbi:rhythmically expressed gene 5 protein [Lucilia sericata]|uniref:rhythmically expressed gene 5 protein n=1 Tax=Lucilia sericata TaxID=13632 RepID=UPI0018A86EEC|nr:rhythmically expressed gene 5 protein [Lucilia sericata]